MTANAKLAASVVRATRGRPVKGLRSGRHSLLDAATYAFAGLGFDNADLRSIAAAARVSPNFVRVHFGSKAALWGACLDAIIAASTPVTEQIAELSRDSSRPVFERLREAIGLAADFYAEHPEVRDFIARQTVESRERADRLTEGLLRPAYEAIRPMLEEAVASGIIHSGHPAIIFALIHNAVSPPVSFPNLIQQIAPELDSTQARKRMVETFAASLLRAPTAGGRSGTPK